MASWHTNYSSIFTFIIRLFDLINYFKSRSVTFGKMTILCTQWAVPKFSTMKGFQHVHMGPRSTKCSKLWSRKISVPPYAPNYDLGKFLLLCNVMLTTNCLIGCLKIFPLFLSSTEAKFLCEATFSITIFTIWRFRSKRAKEYLAA